MGRIALLIVAAFAFFGLVHNGIIDREFINDKLIWAALLPGVYIMGMALLRD